VTIIPKAIRIQLRFIIFGMFFGNPYAMKVIALMQTLRFSRGGKFFKETAVSRRWEV